MSAVLPTTLLIALSPAKGDAVVDEARKVLGTPYRLGGRLGAGRDRREGIDCQGVIFFALERVFGCGWKSYSVYPTRTVARRELGAPVDGMAPVSSTKLDVTKLEKGDVLMLVGFDENPAEGAIGELDGRKVWVWHTGLYAGGGKWIVGDHYAGKAVEVNLESYLREHADTYAGVFVTRMKRRPNPRRCRKHRPMRR